MRRVRNYLAGALIVILTATWALNSLVHALISLWPLLLAGVIVTTFILTLMKRMFW